MRFDDKQQLFEVSVRELAEDEGFHRIGFGQHEGWIRLGVGAELHVRVLNERCRKNPAYLKEQFVQTDVEIDGWKAIITGRLDGCVQSASGEWLIEEFKSAFFSPTANRPAAVSERHRRQLLFYSYLWELLGHSPVSSALVYVDVLTGREISVPVHYEKSAQREILEARLRQLLAAWKSESQARKQKADVAKTLPFPHANPRPGQQKLIEAVRIAIQQSENLLAEAPTGSGKTAASIHPAMAEALAGGRQLFFLTAKTLQQKMAVNALVAINSKGAFRTLQMRSKEKMCANGQVVCHEDFCPYAKNYPEKMERSKLLERLCASQTHHDPDAVFSEAKREQVCPFEVQVELAARADAIVADYNYIFDPSVALKQTEDLENVILVIDEAHNLADRARQIYSPEIREETLRAALEKSALLAKNAPESQRNSTALRKRKKREEQQIALSLDAPEASENSGNLFDSINTALLGFFAILQESTAAFGNKNGAAEIAPPTAELRAAWGDWEPLVIRYLIWKRERKIVQADDPIMEFHFAAQRFISVLNLFGAGFSCVAERSATGIRIAIVCLDPARPLARTFSATASSILISATLSPLERTQRILGLNKNKTGTLSLPPPFPKNNRKILVLPQVRTTFEAREKNYSLIAKHVQEMADAVPGNVLVLFPSYAFLRKIAEALPKTRSRLISQRADISENERQQILRELAAPPPEGILLFAVMGGMYAEGVDYPGELLSGVFVVSPALPQVSFERELLRRYFDEQEQSGFEFAYLLPGMTRVIQAAGRLIRTETDRGVIALICQRFLQEPYCNFLPRDWFDENAGELIARNPASEIQNFFAEIKSAQASQAALPKAR